MRKLTLSAMVALLALGLLAGPAAAKNGNGAQKGKTHASTVALLNAEAQPSDDVEVRRSGDWYVISHEVDATEADSILWREPSVYGGGFEEVAPATVADLWLYAPGNEIRQHSGLVQVSYEVDGEWFELRMQFDEDGVLRTVNKTPVDL